MESRTIWIAGDWLHADFSAAIGWLRERVFLFPLPLGEGRGEGASKPPDAILIVQSRPGLVAIGEIERLHSCAPLARLVTLLGPWCEGEQRSGRPWPGVVRVPWRTWQMALPRALGLGGDQSDPRLPRTATETERWQHELGVLALKRRAPGAQTSVSIRTDSRMTYEGLQGALARVGCAVVADGAALEFIDGWEQWPAGRGRQRVLLLHFPRPDDLASAEELGVAAVLAQPIALADLAETLMRLRGSLTWHGA